MKKTETKAVDTHKSFVLSNSPIENPVLNKVVSITLLMILLTNVGVLIYMNKILEALQY